MEKQRSDSVRVQKIKRDKEEEVKKKMEIAMRTMREKERLREIMMMLRKFPESKIMSKVHEKLIMGDCLNSKY